MVFARKASHGHVATLLEGDLLTHKGKGLKKTEGSVTFSALGQGGHSGQVGPKWEFPLKKIFTEKIYT